MEQRSSLYVLIERQLGRSLEEYVAVRRAPLQGRPPQSWRTIAADLSEEIDFEVNHESLRLWFGKVPAADGAA
jgi:hypothetical protein